MVLAEQASKGSRRRPSCNDFLPMELVKMCVLGALLSGGCATAGSPSRVHRAEAPRETRTDRLSSLPGVDRESSPENQERRFGIEEARARRKEAAQTKAHESQRVELEDGR